MPDRLSDSRDDPLEVTTIYKTGSLALFGLAKAVLESAGIPYVATNELSTDLAGGLRLGGMASLITGPMQIRVQGEDAADARELLADIREGNGGDL